MNGLSVCMIVKNEENILETSLSSLNGIYDELVILDTGSTDNTVSIAEKFTDKVYHTKWRDNFSWARNYAQQFVSMSHTLTWDADYVLTQKSRSRLIDMKDKLLETDRIFVKWNSEVKNGVPQKSLARDMIYRSNSWKWVYPVHNALQWTETRDPYEVFWNDIEIDHHKDRVIKNHRYHQTLKIIQRYLQDNPQDSRMRSMYANGLHFNGKIKDAVRQYEQVLTEWSIDYNDSWAGVVELYIKALIQLKKVDKAQKVLTKSLSTLPYNIRLLLWKADFYVLEGSLQEAIPIYQYCINHPLKCEVGIATVDSNRHINYPKMMIEKLSLTH